MENELKTKLDGIDRLITRLYRLATNESIIVMRERDVIAEDENNWFISDLFVCAPLFCPVIVVYASSDVKQNRIVNRYQYKILRLQVSFITKIISELLSGEMNRKKTYLGSLCFALSCSLFKSRGKKLFANLHKNSYIS